VLPLSVHLLHTAFFRISSEELSAEDKHFGKVCWELLLVLKDNFPSKVCLHEENLDRCAPVFRACGQGEELRRQISVLVGFKEGFMPTD